MKNLNNKKLFFFILSTLFCAIFLFFNTSNALADTFITENIEADTIWIKEGSPYIIKNSISVSLGTTLTIDPGVIVKFDPTTNASINVFGDLVVNGEVDNKIYFTSNYDDTVGGDTDGDFYCYEDLDEDGNFIGEVCDGSGLEPSKDDWSGIYFFDSHNNYIKNAVFKYASNVAFMDHTYLNLKNVETSDLSDGFFAITSNIDADNVNATNLPGSFLYAINSSNVNWINSKINTISSDAIYVFDSSTLNLSDFSIKNVINGSAIYIFRDSSLNADNLQVENVNANWNYAVNVFDGSHLTLNHSSFKNCSGYACLAFYDSNDYLMTPSSIDIENSTLDGGAGSGIITYNTGNISANIHHSTIQNFANYSIEDYASFPMHAENNWWGNATGPYNETKNPTGTAGSIFNPIYPDNVDFIPFCTSEKCKGRNPVILIPGIMGTQIFKDYDDSKEIWPNINKLIFSITDNFLNDLALNVDGTEDPAKPMRLGDIIRGTHISVLGYDYDSHTFDGLIDELNKNGYVEGTDLFVFPYDWRKSNVESAQKLKDKIDKILIETGAEKVDLVAHSMGGLVAKKYIADNTGDKVDQLIFIGTPQLGAPKAFKAIMYGDDMGVGYDINIFNTRLHFLSPDRAKYIAQNMPGVFELLPSKKYVDGQGFFIGQKYITDYVTPSLSILDNPPRPDLSYSQTEGFMKRQGINSKMLEFTDNLHESIDNLDLSELKVSNFIGCGSTKTIARVTVRKKKTGILFWTKFVDTYEIEYGNGDDTVPLRSANNSSGVKYFVKGSSHGELPSATGAKETAVKILMGKSLSSFANMSNDINDCFISGKTITLYSYLPTMQLEVYDNLGNFTGPLKNDNLKANQDPGEGEDNLAEIEYGIPGVQYDRIGGSTYVFLPRGGSYRVVINNSNISGGGGSGGGAENTSAYDLSVENIQKDDTKTNEVHFNDVPVENPEESFEIEIPDISFPGEVNEEIPPVIEVDENGDGTFEEEIPPSVVLDENEVNDALVPNTVSSVLDDVVSLSAEDDNSGVLETDYSLDNGNTWTKYEEPFEVHPTPGGDDIVIEYFSIDNADNMEETKTIIIPAPPLQAPIVSGSSSIHNSSEIILTKNIVERAALKEFQEPTLNNLDIFREPVIPILNVIQKTIDEPDKNVFGKNTPISIKPKSQIASAVNSDFNFKMIWILYAILALTIGVFIARKYKKK